MHYNDFVKYYLIHVLFWLSFIVQGHFPDCHKYDIPGSTAGTNERTRNDLYFSPIIAILPVQQGRYKKNLLCFF